MSPTKATRPSPKPASVEDAAPSEHIYMGSDELDPSPAATGQTVSSEVVLRNKLRRTQTDVTLYAEGFVKIREQSRGKPAESYRLDLHYLDPVPTLERAVALRWFQAALGCGALAALAAFLAQFEPLRSAALLVVGIAATAALITLYVAIYRSHEKITFSTLHGRAPVLRLIANFGSIKKFRAFVPVLSHAVEEAAERIGDDTSAFLRAEMREHYRLRGDGVLDNNTCADSTGRILAQFDIQL